MAQMDTRSSEPPLPLSSVKVNFLRKLFGRASGTAQEPLAAPPEHDGSHEDPDMSGLMRRVSRKVVPGLPRVQTFKRQQSERRTNLAPVEPTPAERRAVSVDRRGQLSHTVSQTQSNPRASAPDFMVDDFADVENDPTIRVTHPDTFHGDGDVHYYGTEGGEDFTNGDSHSITTSEYDARIHDDLERKWILNLSMHFRDKSQREKFFVTYRETETLWRRVTVSLDYRNAPEGSLEDELQRTKFQREKNARIYEAIRESLPDIQFYETVTNLKLQTTDGRLHVHVVEDVNEIIHYPSVQQVQHLGCRRIREQDIQFDSHMSGFVYKVNVDNEVLIKKEIPGPDTISEFLYEINALNRLRFSSNVIRFYGVVVDDHDEFVKGLLISYADRGALIDVLYDSRQEGGLGIPWSERERWAKQIVQGLSDIHECGFVQGDFTLSNIVIDEYDDAKIIDINRRGCPVGWEPPEATPLIESNQHITMYIGVKSDLYQLGMVLWALATEEDEPENQGRPLLLGPEVKIPNYYRQMVEICLSDDPRLRVQASSLLAMFPDPAALAANGGPTQTQRDPTTSIGPYPVQEYLRQSNGMVPQIRTVEPTADWSYVNVSPTYVNRPVDYFADEPYYYTRGRSPPSPMPSNSGHWDPDRRTRSIAEWAAAHGNIPPSYSDIGPEDDDRSATPTTNRESMAEPYGAQDEKLQHAIADRYPVQAIEEPAAIAVVELPPEPVVEEVAITVAAAMTDAPTGDANVEEKVANASLQEQLPNTTEGDTVLAPTQCQDVQHLGYTVPESQADQAMFNADVSQQSVPPVGAILPGSITESVAMAAHLMPLTPPEDPNPAPAARETTAQPVTTGNVTESPKARPELPELKGVGAAHGKALRHDLVEPEFQDSLDISISSVDRVADVATPLIECGANSP